MRYQILLLLIGYYVCSANAFIPLHLSSPTTFTQSNAKDTNSVENIEDGEEIDDNEKKDDNSPELVTREMFQRAMLESKVKRKKRNGSNYKVLDNRDSLPFTVKVMTPDPYTKASKKRKDAIKNTKLHQEKSNKKVFKKRDLLNLSNGSSDAFIAASLFNKMNDGSLEKVVGEFHLDKNTNCGDIIEVGESDYEVVKARCQYKYVGGKQFVMVRKVLEVKEVTRIAQENYLKRQFYNNTNSERAD